MADDAPKNVPGRWVGLESLPVLAGTQFLAQVDYVGTTPDGIILTVGQVKFPAVVGTLDQKREIIEHIDHVDIQALASFSLSRARVNELIELLDRQRRDVFDAAANAVASPAEDKGAEA